MLYRLRFIFTADLCGAWSSFGGIVAQFNNLSVILHLATTETISAALIYDSLLSAHLEELARARQERSAAQVDFAELLSNEQSRFKTQAVAQAAKKEPVVQADTQKEKGQKEKGQKGKGQKEKPPGWLPKAEYLAKQAAEQKAAQAAAAQAAVQAAQRERNRAPSPHRSRSRTPKRRDNSNRRRSNPREGMKRQRRRN